jgi:hypothetical protein
MRACGELGKGYGGEKRFSDRGRYIMGFMVRMLLLCLMLFQAGS